MAQSNDITFTINFTITCFALGLKREEWTHEDVCSLVSRYHWLGKRTSFPPVKTAPLVPKVLWVTGFSGIQWCSTRLLTTHEPNSNCRTLPPDVSPACRHSPLWHTAPVSAHYANSVVHTSICEQIQSLHFYQTVIFAVSMLILFQHCCTALIPLSKCNYVKLRLPALALISLSKLLISEHT